MNSLATHRVRHPSAPLGLSVFVYNLIAHLGLLLIVREYLVRMVGHLLKRSYCRLLMTYTRLDAALVGDVATVLRRTVA